MTRTTTANRSEGSAATATETTVPVLEVGGTHVTAALVRCRGTDVEVQHVERRPLDSTGSAPLLLDALADAARMLPASPDSRLGVAIPGPFDYGRGIGSYQGMGKFEALHGVDVGAELTSRLAPRFDSVRFLNDADAFGIGEHYAGAARGCRRAVCITLGTGIGSAFLADGIPVHTGSAVPPDGALHRLSIGARPLEQTVSRAAIRARYERLRNTPAPVAGVAAQAADVREIADRARAGEQAAMDAISEPLAALGRLLSPWCAWFRSDVLVVGGSISASWDLVAPALRAGITADPQNPKAAGGEPGAVELRRASHPEHAALIGAAMHVLRQRAVEAAVRG